MPASVPIEVLHDTNAMAITAFLPGVAARDLRFGLTREELRVEATSPAGTQSFRVPLAKRVDERRATMHFADGVLSIYLPKLAP